MPGKNECCSPQIRIRQRFTESIDRQRGGPADLGGPIVEVDVDVDARLGGSRGCDLLALARRERMGRAVSQSIEELLLRSAGSVRRRQGEAAGRYRGQSLNDLLRGERVRGLTLATADNDRAKVRLRVVIGVRALTICSEVSGSAAEAGPRPANNMAKAATATAARHLDIL